MIRPFKTSKPATNQVEVPTTKLHLPDIIATTPCAMHGVWTGSPCYEYEAAETNSWHFGICNFRAKSAGMVGEIHQSSLEGRPQQNKRQYA